MTKGINLIPGDIQREWRLKKLKAGLIAAAVAYFAFLSFIFISQRSDIKGKSAEKASLIKQKEELIARNSRYSELTRKYRELQQAESDLKKRLSLASDINEKRVSWSAILKRLSYDVPRDVWLRSLSTSDIQGTNGKKIRFIGSSTSSKGITDFIFTLENTAYFQEVTLAYTQKKDFKSTTVYDFEVSLILKKTDEIMYEW